MTRKRGETVAGGYRSEPPPLRRVGMRPLVERVVQVQTVLALTAERKATRNDLRSAIRDVIETCEDWLAADESTHKPVGLEHS